MSMATQMLEGMPQPADLRRTEVDGQTVITVGARVITCFDTADLGMRNIAVQTLTETLRFTGRRVGEVMDLTPEYVSMLRGRARRHGSAGLVSGRGRPRPDTNPADPWRRARPRSIDTYSGVRSITSPTRRPVNRSVSVSVCTAMLRIPRSAVSKQVITRAPTVITVCPSTSVRRRSAGWGMPSSICVAIDMPQPYHTLNTFRRAQLKEKPHVTPRAAHPLPEV